MYTEVKSLQEPLEKQIDAICSKIYQHPEILKVLLIGSVSRGSSTYRSDIDLLAVVKEQTLNLEKVKKWRDEIEKLFDESSSLYDPLPVQINFVCENVDKTEEPGMKEALKTAIILKPKGP